MKKLLYALVFILCSGTAFSQASFATIGVTHGLHTSTAAAALADSLHYFGTVDMRGEGTARIDSFQIHYNTQDSTTIRFLIVPVRQPIATETIADSCGAGSTITVATGGAVHTATGTGTVLWAGIRAGLTDAKLGARMYKVYARLYAVGTELRGNAKKIKVTIARYQ